MILGGKSKSNPERRRLENQPEPAANEATPGLFIVEVHVFDTARVEGVLQAIRRDHRVSSVKRTDQ